MKTITLRPFGLMLLLLIAGSPCFSQYFLATPIGGNATIRFPGEIKESTIKDGKVVTCSFSDYVFLGMSIKKTDHFAAYNKDSSDAFYATFIKDMATSGGLSNMASKDFTYNGLPGKECTYVLQSGSYGRARLLFTHNTMYTYAVVALTPDNAKSATADAFLNSFKLEQ